MTMCLARALLLLAVLSLSRAKPGWENIQPSATCAEQTEALQGLLVRNIPDSFSHYFKLSVAENCKDEDSQQYVNIISNPVQNGENEIVIIGNSGVSVAFGLNHYLKYFTNSQITWNERRMSLKHPLPEADLLLTSLDKFR